MKYLNVGLTGRVWRGHKDYKHFGIQHFSPLLLSHVLLHLQLKKDRFFEL